MSANELAFLRRELTRLNAEIMKRPARVSPVGSTAHRILVIIDGNTAFSAGATTYYGILRSSSLLTDVPSAYDPVVSVTPGTFTAITGIGRAILWVNGVAQSDPVLVVLDPSSPLSTLLVNGDQAIALSSKALTVNGDANTTVTAYIPSFL